MIPLTVHLTGEAELQAGFSKLLDIFSDFSPIFEKKIGPGSLDDIQHRFDVGGPGWAKHAASTLKKTVGPKRLLRDTDTLYNSFKKGAPENVFKVAPRSFEGGSSVFYGIFHQEGRGHNPERVIVDITPEQESSYMEFMVEGINEQIQQAGFQV